MDLSKYPLEKLLYFVAGVIPGFVAVLIYNVASPYRTKLAVVLLVVFVIGNTMTRLLGGLLGALGGAIGALEPPKPYSRPYAPWRDERWRTVLKRHLGADAPNDTLLMSQELHDLKLQVANLQPPGPQREIAVRTVETDKLGAEIDDSRWAHWYRHYHGVVLGSAGRDFLFHVERGLNFNLETAGVYVLISALSVPGIRHWWCILPALVWTIALVADEYTGVIEWRNAASRVEKQIAYLSALPPRAVPSAQAAAEQ